MPFLRTGVWVFVSLAGSSAFTIENCPAQFLAVCWIVRVEFKVHRLRDGFSVSNALLLGQSARLSRKSLNPSANDDGRAALERSFLRFFGTWNLQFRIRQCGTISTYKRRIQCMRLPANIIVVTNTNDSGPALPLAFFRCTSFENFALPFPEKVLQPSANVPVHSNSKSRP